jgi:hypothetical protein
MAKGKLCTSTVKSCTVFANVDKKNVHNTCTCESTRSRCPACLHNKGDKEKTVHVHVQVQVKIYVYLSAIQVVALSPTTPGKE